MKRYFILLSLSFIISNNTFSQIELKLVINKSLDTSKIKLFYSDGAVKKFITPKFVNHIAVINENIKSRYARLIIMYPNKFGDLLGICFLINKEKSFLQFDIVKDNELDKLSNYRIKNLIDVKNSKIFKLLNSYTKKELNYFNKINGENNLLRNDSLNKLLEKTYEALALKQIEFIKSNGNKYFYFEKFINEIIPAFKAKYLLTLYEIFNTSFPSSFKNSYEGKSARTLLEGNLYVNIGMPCPQFKAIDYMGREIGTEKLKGKYYLISFWATWCSPCLKEIPQLKNIRDVYSEDKLDIISITRDTDSSKFIKGIKLYKMNWLHIFNNPMMENLFGEKPIPSLYLVNKNGKIIFSSWEKSMGKLETILKDELGD